MFKVELWVHERFADQWLTASREIVLPFIPWIGLTITQETASDPIEFTISEMEWDDTKQRFWCHDGILDYSQTHVDSDNPLEDDASFYKGGGWTVVGPFIPGVDSAMS